MWEQLNFERAPVMAESKVRAGAVLPPSGPSGVLRSHNSIARALPRWIWLLAVGLAALGAFAANPVLTPVCILMIPVLASLLWFEGEPPILLFACALQWLQATTAVFYTNHYGLPLDVAYGVPEFERATWLSLVGIFVLACGMRLGRGSAIISGGSRVSFEASHMSPTRLFIVFLATFVICAGLRVVAYSVVAITQPLLAIANLEWIIVFLFALVVIERREGYALLAIALVLEFASGLLGFFSEFKRVLYVLLVAMLTSPGVLSTRRLIATVSVAVFLVVCGTVWTSIKVDYRDFLNQGTGQQEVLVPIPDRVDKLTELLGDVDGAVLENGMENMILRVSYVTYFAQTMINVPANVPYENGALWMGAIKHVFLPRLFFPNKAVINDSERTQFYTGQRVSGTEEGEGTSITIGYLGESYIDFGPIGMFVPVFILGICWGLAYRYLVKRSPSLLLGFSMAGTLIVFMAGEFASNVKIIGGAAVVLIFFWLFLRLGARPFLWLVMASYRKTE